LRDYEALIIVVPEVGEEGLQQTAARLTSFVTDSGGTVQVLRSLGRRTLAYRIGSYQEGIYVLMHFSAPPSAIDALKTELRLFQQVIRFLILRLEEGVALKEEAMEERYASRRGEVALEEGAALETTVTEATAAEAQETGEEAVAEVSSAVEDQAGQEAAADSPEPVPEPSAPEGGNDDAE